MRTPLATASRTCGRTTAVVVEGYTTDLITAAVGPLPRDGRRRGRSSSRWPTTRRTGRISRRISRRWRRTTRVTCGPWDAGTSTRADYVAMVERVDRGVGEVLRCPRAPGPARGRSSSSPTTTAASGWRQRAAVQPQGQRLGGRHPRAGDDALAGRSSRRRKASAGGDQPGPDGVDPRGAGRGGAAERDRTASTCCRSSRAGRRSSARTLFWRTGVGGHAEWAVRTGDWKLVLDGRSPFVFNVQDGSGRAPEPDAASDRTSPAGCRPMLDAWEADVDAEWKQARPSPPAATTPPPK